MQVFYAPPSQVDGDRLTITGDELHHFRKVLRGAEGDIVHVADGAGSMRRVEVTRIDAAHASCRILETIAGLNEPARAVHLAQAVLKNHVKLDWLAEKATELGAASIIPMRTARTIAERVRRERLEGIVLGAMKQCCRCRLPDIRGVTEFADLFSLHPDARHVLCHEDPACARPIREVCAELGATDPVVLVIGPEGGFDDREVELAGKAGASVAWLGSRRLRSETAALAALMHFTT